MKSPTSRMRVSNCSRIDWVGSLTAWLPLAQQLLDGRLAGRVAPGQLALQRVDHPVQLVAHLRDVTLLFAEGGHEAFDLLARDVVEPGEDVVGDELVARPPAPRMLAGREVARQPAELWTGAVVGQHLGQRLDERVGLAGPYP